MRKRLSYFSYLCFPLLGLTCSSMAHAENFYTFGLGTGVAPRYLGSKDYRGLVAPVFSAEFSNGFFISPFEGAGYKKTFANGGAITLTREPSNNRASQIGEASSTRRPTWLTMR